MNQKMVLPESIMKKPKEKSNCIKKSMEYCGQDNLIFIFASSNKKVKVLNELVHNNIVLKHRYLSCKQKIKAPC